MTDKAAPRYNGRWAVVMPAESDRPISHEWVTVTWQPEHGHYAIISHVAGVEPLARGKQSIRKWLFARMATPVDGQERLNAW